MSIEKKIKGEILRGNCWYCDYLSCYRRKKFSLRNGWHFGQKHICKRAKEEIKSPSAKRRMRQAFKKQIRDEM